MTRALGVVKCLVNSQFDRQMRMHLDFSDSNHRLESH